MKHLDPILDDSDASRFTLFPIKDREISVASAEPAAFAAVSTTTLATSRSFSITF